MQKNVKIYKKIKNIVFFYLILYFYKGDKLKRKFIDIYNLNLKYKELIKIIFSQIRKIYKKCIHELNWIS